MKDSARTLDKEARKLRDSGDLAEAGDAYTRAAYEWAGAAPGRLFPAANYKVKAVRELLYAATCYRVAGDDFRTQNRCEAGTVMAEDHIHHLESIGYEPQSFTHVRRGGWAELIGDLRTIAERDDADEAYDEAVSIYEDVGEWEIVTGEKEHMALAAFFRVVKRGLGHDIPDDAPEQLGFGTTFPEWLAYKRERLPGLLEELEKQGEWTVEG